MMMTCAPCNRGVYLKSSRAKTHTMGRPKAVRQRDIVPTIPAISTEKKSHRTFDDDYKVEDAEVAIQAAPTPAPSKAQDSESAPEVVASSSSEIRRLRELHELIGQSKRPVKRKQKPPAAEERKNDLQQLANTEIDNSVLDALNASDPEGDSDNDASSSAKKIEKSTESMKPLSKKKKIGHISIAVIDEPTDPFERFKLLASVDDFQKSRVAAVKRVKFNSVMSQKKLKPARNFASTKKSK